MPATLIFFPATVIEKGIFVMQQLDLLCCIELNVDRRRNNKLKQMVGMQMLRKDQ